MASRRNPRSRFPGARGGRAPTSWARSVEAATVSVAAATKVHLGTVSLSNPGISETVRRTRGLLSVWSDQSAGVEQQLGAFGLLVATDIAIAAGAASLPGPAADASDDGWFVWVPFSMSSSATQPIISVGFDFDSKAMRRIEEGYSAAIMVENASAAFAFDMAWSLSLFSSLS